MAKAAHVVSPLGTFSRDAARQRAAQSAEYRAERQRLTFWTDIAAQVILFRTRHGLTQEDLARKVDTSASAISRMESGQHAVSGETLRRVADALGLRVVLVEAESSELVGR